MHDTLDRIREPLRQLGSGEERPSGDLPGAVGRLGRALGVLCFFGVLTAYHTWPLSRAPATYLQRGPDITTGQWALTELAHNLVRDPAHLLDGNIFYPFSSTIAILDHNLASALLAVPLVASGANLVFTYNFAILATFLLSGVFTYLLVYRLTGSAAAGLVSGCAFAFSGYRASHLPQSHTLVTQWLPLALLTLHVYLERPTWKRWGALAVAIFLVAISSWHIAIIGAIGLALVTLWTLAYDHRGFARKAVGLLLVAALCAVVLLPLARTYAQVGGRWPPQTGEGRETVGTLARNSANLLGLVAPSQRSSAFYAPLLSRSEMSRPGVFPGVLILALAIPALLTLGRLRSGPRTIFFRLLCWTLATATVLVVATVVAAVLGERGEAIVTLLRPVSPFVIFGLALAATGLMVVYRAGDEEPEAAVVTTYAALAAGGALLALGPRVFVGTTDAGSGLWRFDLLPVGLIIRAPERLSLLLALGMAVLAGIGLARLLKHASPTTGAALTVAVLVLLNADLSFRMQPLGAPPPPTEIDRWLAESPEEGAVIEYPLLQHWWAIYSSQRYERRIVNGLGYLFPQEYVELENMPDFSPEQLSLLWEKFHPRFVVVRAGIYRPAERSRILDLIAAQPEALRPLVQSGQDFVFDLADRGRGQGLLRTWPLSALRHKNGLHLEGVLSAGRDDTISELVVLLNDQILLRTSGADIESTFSQLVTFQADQLVPGINNFEIRADYRFAETANGNEIGTTGVKLAADIFIDSNRNRSRVEVNGRAMPVDKGYFLAVLNPATGAVTQTAQFDVSTDVLASEALIGFVREIPAGSPVIVATEFDASRQLTQDAVMALRELGLERNLRNKFGRAHAAIGVKGAPRGSALEATHRLAVTLELGQIDRREVQLFSLQLR